MQKTLATVNKTLSGDNGFINKKGGPIKNRPFQNTYKITAFHTRRVNAQVSFVAASFCPKHSPTAEPYQAKH